MRGFKGVGQAQSMSEIGILIALCEQGHPCDRGKGTGRARRMLYHCFRQDRHPHDGAVDVYKHTRSYAEDQLTTVRSDLQPPSLESCANAFLPTKVVLL